MENSENHIEKFVVEIIKQAGLDKMPEDFLADYTEKVTMEAQKRLGLSAVEALPDDKLKEFTELTEKSPDDFIKINAFLKENISDFEEKMSKALRDFGLEMIESAKKLEKK